MSHADPQSPDPGRRGRSPWARAALFAIGFLAVNSLVNVALAWHFAGATAFVVEEQFEELQGRLDLLVVGDSHAQDGVDPRRLGEAFNYAYRGENYLLSYFKLRHALTRPDLTVHSVVMPFGYQSLSSFWRHQMRPLAYWRRYVDFGELAVGLGEVAYPAVKLVEARLFPYAQDLDEAQHTLFPDAGETFVRGYSPRPNVLTEAQDWERHGEGRALFYLDGEEPLDAALAGALRDVLQLCRDRGARLFLVKFPVTRQFRDAAVRILPPDFEARRAALLSDYPEVEIIDLQDVFLDRPELFANHDHLNARGAALLTEMLRREIGGLAIDGQ